MLSQLVSSFEYRPSEEHKVSWWFGNITVPVVEDAKTKTHKAGMPLRVRCL